MIKFVTGTMGAGKTRAMIREYKSSFDKDSVCCLVAKPDGSWGDCTTSRDGKSLECLKIENLEEIPAKTERILIDEAQFLRSEIIEELVKMNANHKPNVYSGVNNYITCYGLLTNFRGELFEGSKTLLEYGFKLRIIDHFCDNCHEKYAIFNARFDGNGNILKSGGVIDENKDRYKALCYECYNREKGSENNV